MRARRGFAMIYAVLLLVSLGMAFGYFIHSAQGREQTHSMLHARVQLELYTQSVRSMLALCLKQRDVGACNHHEFSFPAGYRLSATLTPLSARATMLDISGSVLHPSSGNLTRLSRRFILLSP